jgi:hypothetical protein
MYKASENEPTRVTILANCFGGLKEVFDEDTASPALMQVLGSWTEALHWTVIVDHRQFDSGPDRTTRVFTFTLPRAA